MTSKTRAAYSEKAHSHQIHLATGVRLILIEVYSTFSRNAPQSRKQWKTTPAQVGRGRFIRMQYRHVCVQFEHCRRPHATRIETCSKPLSGFPALSACCALPDLKWNSWLNHPRAPDEHSKGAQLRRLDKAEDIAPNTDKHSP
jgi:hypothetical protein